MLNENLPLSFDPFRFADNAMHLRGKLLLKNMERLRANLVSDEGEVEVDLEFGVDEQRFRFLKGHLKTHLTLQCQRCMERMKYEVISDFLLGIVPTDEKADKLPERFDPLVVKGPDFFIQDVIEDELIVSFPIVPMHDDEACSVRFPVVSESDSKPVEKDNPFKVIELLRQKRDKE